MISISQNNELYEIRFKYDPELVELIKLVPSRVWNPGGKFWTIHKDKLGFFLSQVKGTKYESEINIQSEEALNENATLDATTDIPNYDLTNVPFYIEPGKTPMAHQLDFMRYALDKQVRGYTSGMILADDPGCISGNATVRIKESGKSWTRECSLQNAYKLFSSGNRFKIKSMCNGRFVYSDIKAIVDKGIQPVIKLTLDNTELVCTPDHEIYTPNGWVRAENLRNGDSVFTNGDKVCPICGSTDDIITYEYSKYIGYCRKCMYSSREGTKYKGDVIYKELDKYGYVKLKGKPTRKSPLYPFSNGEGIYEHHQVWYDNTGHIINTNIEVIHHKNQNKQDNRFENLELMTQSKHAKLHEDTATTHLPQNQDVDYYYTHGVKTWCVPHIAKIVNIENSSDEHVYDVIIDSPDIHNFIANNVVVHNCGKTLETLNLAMYNKHHYGFKHCLIICCINSSKYNWIDDINKHIAPYNMADGYILGTRLKKRGRSGYRYNTGTKERLEDLKTMKMFGNSDKDIPYFIVTNIESIRAKQGRQYVIADAIIELVNKGLINMIAIDEVHKNVSPRSQQGKQILRIKKETRSNVEWIPITGTPIVSRPTDVFLPLKLIDGHNFSSFYTWCKEFCIMGGYGGHDIIGYKNIPRLKTMLQANMIRRLKKDILDLPEKMQYVEYVENTSYQQGLYEDIEEEIFNDMDQIVGSMNPLVKFLRLRQINGSPELVDHDLPVDNNYIKHNAKLAWLLDKLEEIYDRGEKVIVFSNWVEVLRTLYKFVSQRYKTCCFTGTMSEEARQKHKRVFLNNPNYNVMLATIGAFGTTHSAPGVSNEIFYDTPWTYVDRLQAEDRIHGLSRGDKNSTANYYTVLTKDTVDERVWQIMYDKKNISGYIVDGELDIRNNPNLFMKLLGR